MGSISELCEATVVVQFVRTHCFARTRYFELGRSCHRDSYEMLLNTHVEWFFPSFAA